MILQPSALLCFAGLAAFVHYNDERRAVPLGTQNFLTQQFYVIFGCYAFRCYFMFVRLDDMTIVL